MIYFNCDYNEGAHPRIIRCLAETNFEQTPGYGEDRYCMEARRLIQAACAAPDVDVHFLVGGTQANLTLLSAAMRAHHGVISAETGHINVHEAGAIEATGHKVLSITTPDGRLTAELVEEYCAVYYGDATHEHMVKPRVVYISNPTELGTVYSRQGLKDLRRVCDRYDLYLYMDGARLGYGLAAEENDLDLPFLARVCDAFYIGGTKQGALFGEAMVIGNRTLKEDFRYIIKQKGGLFAKGRLLGIQFRELFADGLYFDMAGRAVNLAAIIRAAFRKKGFGFLAESGTNQIFPILPDESIDRLRARYAFETIQRMDEKSCAVRFCTSWATRAEDAAALAGDILRL